MRPLESQERTPGEINWIVTKHSKVWGTSRRHYDNTNNTNNTFFSPSIRTIKLVQVSNIAMLQSAGYNRAKRRTDNTTLLAEIQNK